MPWAQRGTCKPVCDSLKHGVQVADEVPSFQATIAATERAPVAPRSVAIILGDDLHHASVDRVALTGQLRQLLEQQLKALLGTSAAAEDITPSSQRG